MTRSFLSNAVSWLLLPIMIAVGPTAVLASFQILLSPGIMDGDDDGGVVSTLSYVDLKLTSLVPSTLPDLFLSASSPEFGQTDEQMLSVPCVPPQTRAPPLG